MEHIGGVTNPAFMEKLGAWLGFGTIGLGLALALFSSMMVAFKPQPRLFLISTLLSAFIIAFGGGIEFYRVYRQSQTEQAALQLQNYFGGGAWSDLADSISAKFSGSKKVTGNAVSKLFKEDHVYSYDVIVPAKQCRYVIGISQPPSELKMLLLRELKLSVETDERSFYRWLTLCNEGEVAETANYSIGVAGSEGLVRVSTFQDQLAVPQTTPNGAQSIPVPTAVQKPAISLIVCLGELSGNCPEKPDVFYGCGSKWDDSVAVAECEKRGYGRDKARFYNRVSAGGNRCGYAIADVTCS